MRERVINIITGSAGLLLLLWFIAVVILAVLPMPGCIERPSVGGFDIRLDYLYHAGAFAAGTILALIRYGFRSRVKAPPFVPSPRRAVPVTIAMLAVAVAHEHIQLLVPHRSFHMGDIISNMAGVIIALILFPLVAMLLSRWAGTQKGGS